MQVKLMKLSTDAVVPTKGSKSAAGYDLYSIEDATINPSESKFIHTGIALEIPEGYFGAIYARSGLACKHGIRPANCVGVVDSDYRGEVMVCLHNDSNKSLKIDANSRIAQLIIQKFEDVDCIEAKELHDTSRGEGGFGSTGTK